MNTNNLKNKKILITSGPTWIPIDDTRIISNISTGRLGQQLAGDLDKAGAKVTLLQGHVVRPLESKSIRIVPFHYYDDLLQNLKKELKKRYDIVIHAAAVADFRLKKAFASKISSRKKELKLSLVQTPKIIDEIKKLKKNAVLVGFKLSSQINGQTAGRLSRRLFDDAGCDLVVANSLKHEKYTGYIIDRRGKILAKRTTRLGISRALTHILKTN